MEAFIYLIPLSVVITLVGLLALYWSINNNQYEDLHGEMQRFLLRDE